MNERTEIALITGASEGIGRAFAKQLAPCCKAMILVARNGQRLAELASELEAHSAGELTVHTVVADLGTPLGQTQVLEAIRQKGPVSVLVNNAGFVVMGDVADSELDAQQAMLNLHCDATLSLCRGVLPYMREAGRGQIVNLGSIGAFTPARTMAVYVATKAFILSLSRSLAKEEKRHGIAVQCLCPGYTRSAFQERAGVSDEALLSVPEEAWSSPEEVVEASLAAFGDYNRVVVVPGEGNRQFAGEALKQFAAELG